MVDGTLKGALKAVLPHAGGAAARKRDSSWLFVEPGRVLATDRFTIAVCRFTDHEVEHRVRLDAGIVPMLMRALSVPDVQVSTSADGPSLDVRDEALQMGLPSLADNARVVDSVDRIMARYRGAERADDLVAYTATYLSRFNERALGRGAHIVWRNHGGNKPTTVMVGEYFEGAIQPARTPVRVAD